ncbi:MAG: DUF2842 domain-containing protein [Rubellimicrobium sp.]|nr:DUF2842 domain-containing protein [Rubellimicrobium sp.]
MRYRTRRRLALLVLVVGLPLYIIAAVAVMSALDRPPVVVEFGVYVLLGVLWALPLRWLFLGLGRADPDADGDG